LKFGTLEYYQALANALTKDEKVANSGLSTDMLMVFSDVLDADGTPKAFVMKFDNGKVTASDAKSTDKAEFTTTATYAMLAGIAKGEINSQKAKLKLPMVKAMKYMKPLGRVQEIQKEMKDVQY
jgi:putative sterol carrier protein